MNERTRMNQQTNMNDNKTNMNDNKTNMNQFFLSNFIKSTQQSWASKNHPLGLFWYQTFTEGDFFTFMDQYGYCLPR